MAYFVLNLCYCCLVTPDFYDIFVDWKNNTGIVLQRLRNLLEVNCQAMVQVCNYILRVGLALFILCHKFRILYSTDDTSAPTENGRKVRTNLLLWMKHRNWAVNLYYVVMHWWIKSAAMHYIRTKYVCYINFLEGYTNFLWDSLHYWLQNSTRVKRKLI